MAVSELSQALISFIPVLVASRTGTRVKVAVGREGLGKLIFEAKTLPISDDEHRSRK
jgi:hypothetical protein